MDGVTAQTLVDYPYFKTNQVGKDGSGNSTLFFGDWQELVVGVGEDLEMVVSEHQYASFNQTLIMGIAYVDWAVMYPEAFHIHTDVGA